MHGSKVDSASDNVQIKVRSSDTVTYNVEISPDFTCLELRGLLSEKAAVPAARIRLIYQGRILRDEQNLFGCGVQTEHTIHMVTQPEATSRPLPQDANQAPTLPNLASSALPRQHLPHDAVPVSLLSNGRYARELRASSSEFTHMREHLLMSQRADEIREQMLLTRGMDYSAEHAMVQREYGNIEVLLGMMIGFLLGILAGLCLLDSHVSRRLKLGIFIGLVSNAGLGLLRMAMMQSWSTQ